MEAYEFKGGHLGSLTDIEEGIREQTVMLDFATKLVSVLTAAVPYPS